MVNFLLNLSTIEIGTFRAHWRNPSKNMSKCGRVIVTFPSNSSVHYICQLFLLFCWLLFCWSWRWFPFIFVAENRFEHGNYLSSNNQFLDSSDDAAFIFVSSELKVIKFEITSNGCEFISSPDLQLKLETKNKAGNSVMKNNQLTHVWFANAAPDLLTEILWQLKKIKVFFSI